MAPRVSFCEWLSGSYWRLDAPSDDWAIDLSLHAETPHIHTFLRERVWRLSGVVDAERLASKRPLTGTIGLDRLDEARIAYRMTFSGDDGRRYELSANKEWNGMAPLESMTLLAGGIYDVTGEEVARVTLRFDVRADAVRWFRHLRLRL